MNTLDLSRGLPLLAFCRTDPAHSDRYRAIGHKIETWHAQGRCTQERANRLYRAFFRDAVPAYRVATGWPLAHGDDAADAVATFATMVMMSRLDAATAEG